MSDHTSSSVQASMRNNERDWVREVLRETKREISEIKENEKKNDTDHGRYENDDGEMMSSNGKHSERSQKRERNYEVFPSHEKLSDSSQHNEDLYQPLTNNIDLGLIIIRSQKFIFPLSFEKKV